MWIYKWLYGARRVTKRNIKCFYVIIISRPTATTVSTKFHINRLHFATFSSGKFSHGFHVMYWKLFKLVQLCEYFFFKGFFFYFLWLFIIHFYRVPGVEIYQRLICIKKNRIWWMKKYYQLTYTPALSKSRE